MTKKLAESTGVSDGFELSVVGEVSSSVVSSEDVSSDDVVGGLVVVSVVGVAEVVVEIVGSASGASSESAQETYPRVSRAGMPASSNFRT